MASNVRSARQQLNELVGIVAATDDPTLLQRACFALTAILTEYPDDAMRVE